MTTADYLQAINDNLMKEMTTHKDALPPGFNRMRFALNCVTVIQDMLKDPKKKANLEKVAMESVLTTFMKGAYLGLDFLNGECYAIPYGSQMQFQTDYKGEIKLCKKYSKDPIKDIYAKVVREGDEFVEEITGGVQNIEFRPKPFSDADMIGAFAVCVYKDGTMIYDTMSKKEIEHVRNTYSKAKDSQAWRSSTGEMYKKTVLRRLCKMVDLNFDNIEQAKAFDDGGDATFTQLETRQQLALTQSEKPMDISEQIKASGKAKPKEKEPVPAKNSTPEDDYARFEQQYSNPDDFMMDSGEELPFR